MGILIKDMQMPKIRGEYVFLLYVDSDGTATVEGAHSILKGEPFEAVPVPPHGDLIERDALTISTAVPLDGKPYQYVHIDNIKGAQTIIAADADEERREM